jgi:pSer/pThr/pTyr-binding forkhead associated (FHA) protein
MDDEEMSLHSPRIARSSLPEARIDRLSWQIMPTCPAPPIPDFEDDDTAQITLPDELRSRKSLGKKPALTVVMGRAFGSVFALEEAEVVIGRSHEATFPLPDDGVSRRHAVIQRLGGMLLVNDLGSRNGTYLNEVPVHGPTPLKEGDSIRIGPLVVLAFGYLADTQ